MPSRRDLPVLVPTALALFVRAAHLVFLAARDPLFRFPVVDEWFHFDQARQVVERGWTLPGGMAFYKGPALTYLDAVLLSLFGGAAPVALHVVNAALGVVAVFLGARLAGRLGGPRAAWLAGTALALYGTLVFYDGTLLQPPLLNVLLLAAATRLCDAGPRLASVGAAGPRPAERSLLVAGALLGLLTITRGEGVLAIALAAGWAAHASWRGAREPGPWRAAALVVVPAALVVAPVTARNVFVARDAVLVSWNGGINVFMGNDPAFDQGSGNWHPDLAWTRLYEAPRQLGLTRGADHQRFFLRQSWQRAVEEPAATLALLARKAALTATGYEISNNRRIYAARAYSPVLSALLWQAGPVFFPFTLAGPLIAAGLALGGRRVLRPGAPVLLLALSVLAVPVLVFQTARYRLPGIVLLVVLAAAGWSALAVAGTRRRIAIGGLAAAAVLGTGLAVTPVAPALPPSDTLNLADVAEREQRMDERLRLRTRAVEAEPDDPLARMRLGDALLTARRPADAMEQFRAVAGRTGLAADWRNAATRSVARCLFDLGRFDESAAWYRRFLEADPDRPTTGGRHDFHLRGVAPLQACAIRLELARALDRARRTGEALAQTNRVAVDCAESESLSHAAQQQARQISLASRAGAGAP